MLALARKKNDGGRSREGAWIEIITLAVNHIAKNVAPARERGLKFRVDRSYAQTRIVAPARERGLKL